MSRVGLPLVMVGAAIALAAPGQAQPVDLSPIPPIVQRQQHQRYRQVIERTQAMVQDPQARQLAESLGLDILNVTWEDTGRFYGSAVGPNISDMTIQVQQLDPDTQRQQLHLMPVIRHPNFVDLTADIRLDQIALLVGNETGDDLRRVPLAEVLGDLRSYLHSPGSWAGRGESLLAPARDSHVLVSAQACFLPIPPAGEASFNPVLFNYQSQPGDPAVLTLLATRQGTSITVIDNQRDGLGAGPVWGQRLFFNNNGERASLTGQRLSDFQRDGQSDTPDPTRPPGERAQDPDDTEGLNLVLLIQVPLKQRRAGAFSLSGAAGVAPAPSAESSRGPSDVEAAVIGHGPVEGPFTEIDNLPIERDPDYPIRVTVQFYKATSNGAVSEADLADIREQIDRVYADADYVGSLVVDGPSQRPTEHDGPHREPRGWWQQFWRRHHLPAHD
ncbi:MAG TPA: hypothetical protein VLS96_05315 [Nodosilinea sp.]|nr:hypothetical protein [Nodosilinea sp.]